MPGGTFRGRAQQGPRMISRYRRLASELGRVNLEVFRRKLIPEISDSQEQP